VGLALGQNKIDKDVVAHITNVPKLSTSGSNLIVDAQDSSSIDVDSYAASVSVAVGQTAVAISGGASAATNSITSRVNSYIDSSVVGTTQNPVGKVDVTASSDSTIDASVGAGAAAIGVSKGSVGVGFAVGIAVARNFIGLSPTGATVSGTILDSNSAPVTSLTPGMKVRVIDGALEGEIYEYIGTAASDSDPFASGNQAFALDQQQYRDTSLWRHINAKANGSEIKAFVKNSSLKSNQSLNVHATSSQTLDSKVVGVALGIGVSKDVGVGIAAAGTYAENRSLTNIQATLDGQGSIAAAQGIAANGITVIAADVTSIDSTAVSGAIAGAFGSKIGVAAAIGVSLAYNDIQNDVTASITDYQSVQSTNGIVVDAKTLSGDAPTATYSTSSGSKTLVPGNIVALSDSYSKGGKSGRQYTYRGFTADYDITGVNFTNSETNANVFQGDLVRVSGGAIYSYVGNDNSNQGIQLNLSNQNYSDTAKWELATVTLNTGNTVKTNSDTYYRYLGKDGTLSLGQESYTNTSRWQSISPNTIDLGNADYSNTKLWEISDGSITTTAVAASIAAAYGSTAGVGISGAGASSRNRILSKTNAFVDNSTVTSTGDVEIQSRNTSKIDAKVVAASVAVGASGKVGVGASIGVAIAENLIGWSDASTKTPTEVKAYVSDSGMILSGGLDIHANDAAQINALVFAGSVAVAVGGQVGVGLSGAGVSGINKIATDVQAYIDGDNRTNATSSELGIQATSVEIQAIDSTRIDALAGAATIAAAFGNIGVAVSVGVAVATNAIDINTFAHITDVDNKLDTNQGAILCSFRGDRRRR
jgi:hypothetical protein